MSKSKTAAKPKAIKSKSKIKPTRTEPRPKITAAPPIVETPIALKLKTLAIKINPTLHANFYKAIGGKGKATAYLTAVLNLAVENAGSN